MENFELSIQKSLIDIKIKTNKTYTDEKMNGFNIAKRLIKKNEEKIKEKLEDQDKKEKFDTLLKNAKTEYKNGDTSLGNLSELLDLVSTIVEIKYKNLKKKEILELTGTDIKGSFKTSQKGDCTNNSKTGEIIREYNKRSLENPELEQIDAINEPDNKIYNDIREFSLSDNVKCLSLIRKKITELFNKDNIFKSWIQNTFKQDEISLEAKDINCLIERKSYLYLFFLFLVAYENNDAVQVEAMPLGKILEVNNNTSNAGKVELLKEKRKNFSLDVRQSLAVQRFTNFNRDENGKIKDKACFLFHGVGTGKTLTSLSIALTHLRDEHRQPESPLKILLIAPEGLFRAAFLGDDAELIGISVFNVEFNYLTDMKDTNWNPNEYIENASGEVEVENEKGDSSKYFIEFIGYNYNALCSKVGGLKKINEVIGDDTILICDEAHRLVLPDKGLQSLKPYDGPDFTKKYEDGTHATYITMCTPQIEKILKDEGKPISIATMSKTEPKNIIRQYAFLRFCMKMSQCVFLTGTPIQYNANDLIDIINFLNAREVGGDDDVNLRLNQSNYEIFLNEKIVNGNDNDERIFKPFVGNQTMGDTIIDLVYTVDNFNEYLNGLYNGKVDEVAISNATHRVAVGGLNIINALTSTGSYIRNQGGALNAGLRGLLGFQKGGTIENASNALKEAIKNFNTINDDEYTSTLNNRPATLEGYLTYLIQNKKEFIFKDKLSAIFRAFEGVVDNNLEIIKKDELKQKLQKVPVMFQHYITASNEYFNKLKKGYSDDGATLFLLSNNLEESIKNFYNSIIDCSIHHLTTFNPEEKTEEEKKYALFQMVNIKQFINDWYNEHVLDNFKIVINFTHLNLFQSELQKSIEKAAESIPEEVRVKNDSTKTQNDNITINISNPLGNENKVTISRNATVEQLKKTMGIDLNTKLTFGSNTLDNTRTLSSYYMENGNTIKQMQMGLKTGYDDPRNRSSMFNKITPYLPEITVYGGSKLGKRTVGGNLTVIDCAKGVDFVVEYLRKIQKISKCMLDDVAKNLFKIGMPNGIQEQILYFTIMNSGLVFNFIFGKNSQERETAYSNLNSFGLLTSQQPSVLGETLKTFYKNGMIQSIEELRDVGETALKNVIKSLAKYFFGDITSLLLTIGPTITNTLISLYKQLNEYNVNKLIEHSKKYISIYNYDYEIKGIKDFLYNKKLPFDVDNDDDIMFDTKGNTNHFPNKFVTNIIVPYTSEQIQEVYMKTDSAKTIEKAQLEQLQDGCPSITENDMATWRESLQKVKPEVISECGCGIDTTIEEDNSNTPDVKPEVHSNQDDKLIHIPKNFSIEFLNGLIIRELDIVKDAVKSIYTSIYLQQPAELLLYYYKKKKVEGLIENIHNNLPKNENEIQNNFIKNIMETNKKQMRFEIILHIMKLTRCGVIFKRGQLYLHPHYFHKNETNTYQYFLPIFYPTTEKIMNSFIKFMKEKNFKYIHMTGNPKELNERFKIGSKMTFPIASYEDVNNNPICVIIKPEHTEGYSFVYNPILCCPALCKTSGDTEQVYGRILRKYNERNEQLILNRTTNGYKFDKHIYQFFGGKREDQDNIETIHRAYFPQGEKNISSCGELEFFSRFIEIKKKEELQKALVEALNMFEEQHEQEMEQRKNEQKMVENEPFLVQLHRIRQFRMAQEEKEKDPDQATNLLMVVSNTVTNAASNVLEYGKSSIEKIKNHQLLNESLRKFWQSWKFSDLLPLSFKMNPKLDAIVKTYLSFIVSQDGIENEEVKEKQKQLRQQIISEGQNFPLSPFVSEEGQLKQLANVTNISENYFNRLVQIGEISKDDKRGEKIIPFDITLINNKSGDLVNCMKPQNEQLNTFLCLTEIVKNPIKTTTGGRKTKRNRKKLSKNKNKKPKIHKTKNKRKKYLK